MRGKIILHQDRCRGSVQILFKQGDSKSTIPDENIKEDVKRQINLLYNFPEITESQNVYTALVDIEIAKSISHLQRRQWRRFGYDVDPKNPVKLCDCKPDYEDVIVYEYECSEDDIGCSENVLADSQAYRE